MFNFSQKFLPPFFHKTLQLGVLRQCQWRINDCSRQSLGLGLCAQCCLLAFENSCPYSLPTRLPLGPGVKKDGCFHRLDRDWEIQSVSWILLDNIVFTSTPQRKCIIVFITLYIPAAVFSHKELFLHECFPAKVFFFTAPFICAITLKVNVKVWIHLKSCWNSLYLFTCLMIHKTELPVMNIFLSNCLWLVIHN